MNIVYKIYIPVSRRQLAFMEFFDYDFVTLDTSNMVIDLDLDKGNMLPHIKRK